MSHECERCEHLAEVIDRQERVAAATISREVTTVDNAIMQRDEALTLVIRFCRKLDNLGAPAHVDPVERLRLLACELKGVTIQEYLGY